MTDYLGRKYRMVSEDKFDDYMKALGVNIILRKVGTTVMSDFLLTEKDGVYHMAITSTFRNQFLDFRPGVEMDETTLDHRKVKTVFTLTNDTLVQHQKGEKETTLVRKFSDEEIITTLTVDDIVATTVSKFVERV